MKFQTVSNKFAVLLTAGLAVLAAVAATPAGPADFSVRSPLDGRTFRLSDSKGKYVALHFLLKTECPFCLRHTRDYVQRSTNTPDVIHIFLKPDSEEAIKNWAPKANAGIPEVTIYRDPDAKLAEQFGIPGGYQFHGQTVHYPALVLLNPEGKEVFRYIGQNNSDRLSYEQFSSKLDALKGKPAAIQHYNLGADRVAIGGYDAVGYFTEGKSLKGSKEINANHRGVTYYFASEDHRKLFTESAEKYVPAYGGWCATAMAKGEKVEINPGNFKITNGRLFLFFKAFYANALKDWNKDEPNLTAKADANWSRIARE